MESVSNGMLSKTHKMNMLSGVVLASLLLSAQASQAASTTINANGFRTNARTYATTGDSLIYRDDASNVGGVFTWGGSDNGRQLLVFEFDPASLQNTQSLKLTFTFNFGLNTGSTSRSLSFWDVNNALANKASGFTSSSETVNGSFADLGSCSGAACTSYASYTMPNNGTTTSFTASVYLNQQAINNLKASGKFAIGVDASVAGNPSNALSGRISNAQLVSSVPLPPAALLFGPAVLAIGRFKRKNGINQKINVA